METTGKTVKYPGGGRHGAGGGPVHDRRLGEGRVPEMDVWQQLAVVEGAAIEGRAFHELSEAGAADAAGFVGTGIRKKSQPPSIDGTRGRDTGREPGAEGSRVAR